MKTSSSQFEIMVTFMEQHEDLNKPTSNARDRISNIKNWEQLTELLNSDGGETKTTEKWKKVWSDFKNNTKKKAARLHRAACGGPAVFAKLSDLEQRVLSLIGVKAATCWDVEEAGLLEFSIELNTNEHQIQTPLQNIECDVDSKSISSPLASSASSPSLAFVEKQVRGWSWNEPGTSIQPHIAQPLEPSQAPAASPLILFKEPQVENMGVLSPTRPSSQVHITSPEPARSGQTTYRRSTRPPRTGASPRVHRVVRPSHADQTAQHFLQAEENWRNFKIDQHRDYIDMRRETNRIREMEIQVQREWQAVGHRALDILDRLVNKYCNK